MIYEINDRVNFVKGAKNGAIYDFNTGKVYSVNNRGCTIIEEYISGKRIDDDYLLLLEQNNLINVNYNPHIYEATNNLKPLLKMVNIEITEKCNLRCVHCYEGQQHFCSSDVLSLEQWKNVINQLSSEKTNTLVVLGGEPCCYDYAVEILNYASNLFPEVVFITNATLIDDKLLDTLVKAKIKVKISIYGHNSQTHDGITGVKGSFDKLNKNIVKLLECKVNLSLSIIIMRENEQYIDDIIAFAKSLGADIKKIEIIREVYGGNQLLHFPKTKKALDYAFQKKPNFWTNEDVFIRNIYANTCWYGKITIKENGDVIPCGFERNFIYGNVKDNSINEIINNEKTSSRWYLSYDKIEVCKDCEYRYCCKDCRPLGISNCGSLVSKNPRCLYDPYLGQWMDVPNSKYKDIL